MSALLQVAETTVFVPASPDIDLGQVDAKGNTPQMVTRRVPLDLLPGDRVLLSGREEFSTGSTDANWNAAGAWTVNGVKSERWSLWVMVGWGVRRTGPSGVVWARRMTATNIDSFIHHTTVDFTEWDTIAAAGSYSYETVCYFARSNVYYRPGATVRVEPGYGALTAAVFR